MAKKRKPKFTAADMNAMHRAWVKVTEADPSLPRWYMRFRKRRLPINVFRLTRRALRERVIN